MTGGCDSKTTIACANGLYDRFSYYSYISSEPEKPDADAAHKIAGLIGVEHAIHMIPDNDSEYKDIELIRMIINCNCGYIGVNNENDVRKRVYYLYNKSFDTEIKSWVSEAARAYYYKRFAKERFPKKVTPRYMTAMYKVFFTERNLVRKTDNVFRDYLNRYYNDEIFSMVPWTDLLFWEYRISSWNSLVISHEQQLSYDIAIPYNNRRLLELMLSLPLDKRISDTPHKDIQKLMNKKIADTSIAVTNLMHTDKRAKFERLYLSIQTKLPF